ncbi:MAG: VOC family protein [Pseudomonadota bacterium]
MALHHFIWNDLSTFDMRAAQSDYGRLFGWAFEGDRSYRIARVGGGEAAAVFPMPEAYVAINMPSFWMSYVHVEGLDAMVDKARSYDGVVIEVEPTDFDSRSRIALVRDPVGAGFTLYEGPELNQACGEPGTVAGINHHCADTSLVMPFYEDLFGWQFQEVRHGPWPSFDILHSDGSKVAGAEAIPDDVRGKFRYWMPSFAVRSTEEFGTQLQRVGGALVGDFPDGRLLASDRQGAHFMVEPF